MTQIDKKATTGIKMTVGRPVEAGHKIKMQQDSAIQDVFGTDSDLLAKSLLNHCLKPLSKHETDIANPSAVERMLAVQMATIRRQTVVVLSKGYQR